MRNLITIYTLFSVLLVVASCSEDFLDRQPLDASATSTFWTSEADVEMALTGSYTYLRNLDNDIFLASTTDDAFCNSTWPIDIPSVGNGSATSATGAFTTFWTNYFNGIAATNNLLENIDLVPDLEEARARQYEAEARFLRAYFYQQLVGFYGEVPLLTAIPSADSLDVSRTPTASITSFIISELEEITDDLPVEAALGRVTRGAALGLKARTLLYDEQYTAAAAAAQELMDMNQYAIEQAGFLSMFDGTNKESAEIILSATYLNSVSSQKHGIVSWIAPPSLGGWSSMVPLGGLVNAYECTDGNTIETSSLYDPANPYLNRDPRLGYTIILPGTVVNGVNIDVTRPNSVDRIGSGSLNGLNFRKYIPADISGDWYDNSGNDEVLMRYAEILLIYAESKIEAGDIDQSVYDAINEVRQRADVNMPAVSAAQYASQDDLRTLVRRERRVELALEPFRLFDIRRWNIGDEVMNGTVYGIYNYFDDSRSDFGSFVTVETRSFNESRDYLWAIPQSEIDINDNLDQNPNW